jgi:hypothetical protein
MLVRIKAWMVRGFVISSQVRIVGVELPSMIDEGLGMGVGLVSWRRRYG